MITFLRNNIEYVLLVALYSWIGFCSIFNMGILAAVVFLILVVSISKISARASVCLLIALLYSSMSSLNIPSPIIISVAIILLFNLSRLSYNYKQELVNKLLIPYVLFVILRLLSLIYIQDRSLYSSAINIDINTLVFMIIAIGLIGQGSDVEFVAKWFGIIGVLATILGFAYYTFNDTAYLGSISSSSSLANKGVIGDDYLTQAWLRWVPVDKEPNYWAANLLLPLGYWLSKVTKEMNVTSVICLLITFLGVFGTYSRSSFLAALIVFVFAVFRSSPQKFLVFIVVTGLAVVGLETYFPSFVSRVLTIQDNIQTSGGSGRFLLWRETINIFGGSPIWGIGAGQTTYFSAHQLGSHNTYLQILGESGIIGFICFCMYWIAPLIKARKFRIYDKFYYFALLGFSINLLTIHNLDLRLPFFILIMFYLKCFDKQNVL